MANSKIKFHCLSDDKMRELGFSDKNQDKWYYCSQVSSDFDQGVDSGRATFNLTIDKKLGNGEIVVLDENYLQPYDFDMVLSFNPKCEYAMRVRANVEKVMFALQQAGVISGWEFGMKL